MENDNSRVRWFLEGESRDNSPWIIPIHNSTFYIGRLNTSDLILSSSSVSRKHAELRILRDELYITDLKSKNGTYINGKLQDSRTLLRNDDLLQIGNSEFKVFTKIIVQDKESSNTLVGLENNKEISFSDFYRLSDRESEVMFFLVKGLSLQIIGNKLFISKGTVKNHVLKIYKKTNCHSRIELSTEYSEYHRKK